MKENLGLNNVLDIEPGNIAVPHPDTENQDNMSIEEQLIEEQDRQNFQDNLNIIQKQANFPIKPPVHPPTCIVV
jgi:hypothetical protein